MEKIYSDAIEFTKAHYENFPVVSLFISKQLRKHVAIVYQFARQADDIVDEGTGSAELRIQNLELYNKQLSDSLDGKFASPFWGALYNTINQFNLTTKNFYDLLDAFKQDVTKSRYQTFQEVIHYCERSANPVGRIILEFYDIRDRETLKHSDAICTALQLTNFYQDTAVDFAKNRIYIPAEDFKKFGVTENIFQLKENNLNFQKMLKYQVDRTQQFFDIGKRLLSVLPARLRMQIKMTILGGEEILKKISYINYNVLNMRPTLTKKDFSKLFLKALFK